MSRCAPIPAFTSWLSALGGISYRSPAIDGWRRALLLSGLLLGVTHLPTSAQEPSIGNSVLRVVELGSWPGDENRTTWGARLRVIKYMRPEWDILGSRYRVVYDDQRGCGRSHRRGPDHWEQHVADLHTLGLAISRTVPSCWRDRPGAAGLRSSTLSPSAPGRRARPQGIPPWPIRGRQNHDAFAELSAHPPDAIRFPDVNAAEPGHALEITPAGPISTRSALDLRPGLHAHRSPLRPTWDSVTKSARALSIISCQAAPRLGQAPCRQGWHLCQLSTRPKPRGT